MYCTIVISRRKSVATRLLKIMYHFNDHTIINYRLVLIRLISEAK